MLARLKSLNPSLVDVVSLAVVFGLLAALAIPLTVR
jgi:hypothetical protein